MTHLAALGERIDKPLLVTNLVNVKYLVGFESSNAALLVQPGGDTTLYTDFRYAEAAKAVDGVEVVMTKRSLLGDVASRLSGSVQFESSAVSHASWKELSSGSAELVPVTGVVEGLRAVKSEDEVAKIKRAAQIADRAFEALTAETFVGRSEREVAWRLRELLHAHGSDALSFESIVASGPNGALPHGRPTDKIIAPGELVTVDWGCGFEGYYSDSTRTVSTGGISDRLREIYEVCLRAQVAACEGLRAGVTGVDGDALARDVIEAAGYGGEFGHGLGHGLGLEVHEAPTLSTASTYPLEPGNVVTVEPGIYLPGVGGVRIEDDVVVRENGVELLTSFPKQLIEVR
ncbi:MAG TPA: Xaa-Pro peptidase family protein [Gaiellaceae bacterium]|nr:Xaa-Pro peptidase family protein [Gaiellaceae bacterium]